MRRNVVLTAAMFMLIGAAIVMSLMWGREVEVVRPRLMLDRYNAFGGTGVSAGSRGAASST